MGLFKALGAVCHTVESVCHIASNSITACEPLSQVIENSIAQSVYDSRKELSLVYKEYEENSYENDYEKAIEALKKK